MIPALHNHEAEQSILGALMYRAQCWDEVAPLVQAEDFYTAAHQCIFFAVAMLNEKSEPVDIVTVTNALAQQGELERIGGEVYIQTLAANVPSATNAPAYARIVRELAQARTLLRATQEAADCIQGAGDLATKLEHAQALLNAALDRQTRHTEIRHAKSVLYDVIDVIEHAMEHGNQVTGLSSGLIDLDKQITGLHPGNLIIIAGRPAMGKTTLATNIARHVATQGTPALIFSAEMEATEIMMREVAALAGVPLQNLRTGSIAEAQWPAVHKANAQLGKSALFVDDTAGGNILTLRAKARGMRRKYNIGLIVVDYIQLLEAPGRTREEEVATISRTLKQLAKELKIPVIALSQLNRSLEGRANKRPILADLRESGAIEQDADVVLCLYRDEVYIADSEYRGLAEILVRKHRNGQTGSVHTVFRGELCRFDNFAGSWPSTAAPKRNSGGLNYSLDD